MRMARGARFLIMNTEAATDSRQSEMRRVTVNYEGLIFRRGRIQSRSFVREFDAAHYRRASRYAVFLARNYVSRRTIQVSDANLGD